ncbi:uncharacterized protein LOC129742823 [Uranotaenia lowii]|uniref:uncharacterized protein LOC129742823 n=1 Tax=Uranotaenia lowii TaxID=190385 RepID=UPI0024791FFC|nr:uncharacterized protein LOC129742823 [Uranotaenia lowii]
MKCLILLGLVCLAASATAQSAALQTAIADLAKAAKANADLIQKNLPLYTRIIGQTKLNAVTKFRNDVNIFFAATLRTKLTDSEDAALVKVIKTIISELKDWSNAIRDALAWRCPREARRGAEAFVAKIEALVGSIVKVPALNPASGALLANYQAFKKVING